MSQAYRQYYIPIVTNNIALDEAEFIVKKWCLGLDDAQYVVWLGATDRTDLEDLLVNTDQNLFVQTDATVRGKWSKWSRPKTFRARLGRHTQQA